MPYDKSFPQNPGHARFMERVKAAQASDAVVIPPDTNAAAGVRVAEAIQKIVALEDPVVVLLALGLQVGATAARMSPPDLAQAMSTVHTVARHELKRRRPGIRT